jgi:hypothetical protein
VLTVFTEGERTPTSAPWSTPFTETFWKIVCALTQATASAARRKNTWTMAEYVGATVC